MATLGAKQLCNERMYPSKIFVLVFYFACVNWGGACWGGF